MTAPAQHIEHKAFSIGKWGNALMAVAGIGAALVSNADALMLDGLFSGVNFLAILVASRVASSVARMPDPTRPFGYEIDESVYVMFRSLVLLGIIAVALYVALDKIVTYAIGGPVPELKLDWIVAYAAAMAVICAALALSYRHYWMRTGRRSEVLRAEITAATIDGALSAAAGGAFVLLGLLKGTTLAFLVPISDSLVIIALAAYMLRYPIAMFRRALGEVVGAGIDAQTTAALKARMNEALAGEPYELIDVGATRAGRSLLLLACVRPAAAVSAEDMDRLRDALADASRAVHSPLRMEVIFTARAPFAAEAA